MNKKLEPHEIIEKAIWDFLPKCMFTSRSGWVDTPVLYLSEYSMKDYARDESMEMRWFITPSPSLYTCLHDDDIGLTKDGIDYSYGNLASEALQEGLNELRTIVTEACLRDIDEDYALSYRHPDGDFILFTSKFNDVITIHQADNSIRITVIYSGQY